MGRQTRWFGTGRTSILFSFCCESCMKRVPHFRRYIKGVLHFPPRGVTQCMERARFLRYWGPKFEDGMFRCSLRRVLMYVLSVYHVAKAMEKGHFFFLLNSVCSYSTCTKEATENRELHTVIRGLSHLSPSSCLCGYQDACMQPTNQKLSEQRDLPLLLTQAFPS